MSEAAMRAPIEALPSERSTQILDAAERSFARSGFHRTTMQDVAAEAGMSPGNLYRYFPSKDALVAGLCERDRADLGREFAALRETDDGFLAAFRELGRRHFEHDACGKAKLCLEIWAEATRNPSVAEMQGEFHRSLQSELIAAFEEAKKAGDIDASIDTRAVASILAKLGDGMFVRRALATDFDPKREIAEVFTVIKALLDGTITFRDSCQPAEAKS